jgi:hypothetical protein
MSRTSTAAYRLRPVIQEQQMLLNNGLILIMT